MPGSLSSIDRLPPELVERIAVLLSLSELRALRIANRRLSFLATQEHFRSFCRSKSVRLDTASLEDLVASTEIGGLGCLLEDLTLVVVVYDPGERQNQVAERTKPGPDPEWEGRGMPKRVNFPLTEEEFEQATLDLAALQRCAAEHEQAKMRRQDLLIEAFVNLGLNCQRGRLRSLSMEVVVFKDDITTGQVPLLGGSWVLIWRAAAEAFRAICVSLGASALPIERLDIFNGARARRCSIACDELKKVKWTPGLARSFAALQSLSISISDIAELEENDDAGYESDESWRSIDTHRHFADLHYRGTASEDALSIATRPENFTGLAELLARCTQVQSLGIEHYALARGREQAVSEVQSRGIFQQIASAHLPALKECSLGGLRSSEQQLISFLRQSAMIKDLSLSSFTVTERDPRRAWRDTLSYCVKEAKMDRIALDSLHDIHGSIYAFKPDPSVSSNVKLVYHPPAWREDNDIFRTGGWMVTTLLKDSRWRRRMKARFGPPIDAGYALAHVMPRPRVRPNTSSN